jgi:hypothetical protein
MVTYASGPHYNDCDLHSTSGRSHNLFAPNEAVPLADGTYRVVPMTDYDPTDEVWEFAPGSIVHCESIYDQSGPYLLAIAELGVDGSSSCVFHSCF